MASRDRASYLITAEDDSKRALDSAKRGLRGLSDQADSVRRGLRTLTAGLSVGAFVAFVKSGINAAEQLSVVSKRLGVTVEDLSVLKFAAEQSDTSFESLTAGLQRFEQNLAKAGISGTETISMLTALADRIQQTEDPAKRLQIAVQAFGRSAGPELVPFLAQGSAGIQGLIDKAREMGLEISGETARAADEFNDKLGALKNQLSAVAVELGGGVIQGLGDFKGIMTDRAFLESIHDIGEGIGGLVRALVDYKNEIIAVLGALAGFRVAGLPGAIVGGIAAGSGGSLIQEFQNRNAESPGNSGAATEFDGDLPIVPLSGTSTSSSATATPGADIDRLLKSFGGGEKAGGSGRRGGAGSKRDEFAEALEGLKREIAMTGELTNAEKILYETQQGRYAAFTEAQKQALVAKAGELDATVKSNQAAEESAKLAEDNREKVKQGIEALKSETEQANIDRIEDDRARAEAELEIEARQWRETIALAQEGTAERRQIEDAYGEWLASEREGLASQMKTESEEMVELMRETARDMQNAMSGLFFDILQGRTDDFGARFKSFIDQMISDWLAAQVSMAFFGKGFGDGGGLGGIFGSLFGGGAGGGDIPIDVDGFISSLGFAKGGAFAGGNVIPFARGGVVGRKMMTPMALMGEAGPEAIMPLRRLPDGNLGVMSGGQGPKESSQTVVHFHLPNVTNRAEFERSVGQSARNAAALMDRASRRNG